MAGFKPEEVSLERNSNFFLSGSHLPWRNVSEFQQAGLGVLSKAAALGLTRRSQPGKPMQAGCSSAYMVAGNTCQST